MGRAGLRRSRSGDETCTDPQLQALNAAATRPLVGWAHPLHRYFQGLRAQPDEIRHGSSPYALRAVIPCALLISGKRRTPFQQRQVPLNSRPRPG
jgi:hypothetical protein